MRMTVLVVDDNRGVRDALQIILEEEGYEVRTAADGAEALEAVQAQPPDLLLIDLEMPVMNGWELRRRLCALGVRTPTVVMTAGGAGRVIDECPVQGHLAKPFTVEELLQTVARIAPPPSSSTGSAA
ncbi:MAG: response regulator [Dehalococcoidia bacterium]